MIIQPVSRLRGRLRMPGDKSISHRAAILAALARGRTEIAGYSSSEDCASTLGCLEALGVKVERRGASVVIEGAGRPALSAPAEALDCGNSGSTMRMLAGVLAGQPFVSELTGDGSLRSRPMRRIIEPLELMGARVESRAGLAPLRITGRRPLVPISYRMPVASAQVKSCILLAGLQAEGRTSVIEKGGRTRDHTERLLGWFGAALETGEEGGADGGGGRIIRLEAGAELKARPVRVPGDISSAAFFIAAAALLPGSELSIEGLGLNPTRALLLRTMRELGASVRAEEREEISNEPVGTVSVRGGESLEPSEPGSSNLIRGASIPQLIDELPMLAVVGTQVEGGLAIRDAAELRLKESDRIAATAANLRAMGASVEEHEDGLTVDGPVRLRGALLDARADHRIAMAFTVAALVAEGESRLEGAECVRISFPEFFGLLETVVQR